ncbi:MAG: helix-turn-helix domain-containing protein [Clostridia bacterium]|nr:helix-turn-helix domain-containing protein [Clostridia bacterium]
MERIMRYSSLNFKSTYESIQIEDKTLETDQNTHWHNYFEIEYIVDGDGEYTINDIKSPIEPGNIFFSTPTDFQKIKFSRRTHIINISFSGEIIDKELLPDLTNPVISTDRDEYYYTILKNILTQTRNTHKHNLLYISSMLNALLISLLQSGNVLRDTHSGSVNPYFHKTMLYLGKHFAEPISLDNLAANVNISPQYLCKIFRKDTGITISQYINEMRLNHAKSLLKMSSLSINEICIKSGFNTSEHFTRAFKKRFGISPSQYRKKSFNNKEIDIQ